MGDFWAGPLAFVSLISLCFFPSLCHFFLLSFPFLSTLCTLNLSPTPPPLDGQGQTSVQEMRLYSLRPVRLPWGPGRPVAMEGEVGRHMEGEAPSLGLRPGDCAQGVWVCHWSLSAPGV